MSTGGACAIIGTQARWSSEDFRFATMRKDGIYIYREYWITYKDLYTQKAETFFLSGTWIMAAAKIYLQYIQKQNLKSWDRVGKVWTLIGFLLLSVS